MPVRDAKACDVVDGTIEPIDGEEKTGGGKDGAILSR